MSYRQQGDVLFCFSSSSEINWYVNELSCCPVAVTRQPYLPHSLPLWPHHHIQQFKVRKASQRELK